MAAGFVGFASKLETMTIDGFVQKFSSDVHQAARYMTGQTCEVALQGLFDLHRRHACQVSGVMDAKLKQSISLVRKGMLPDNCLISMVARCEHRDIQKLLKVGKTGKAREKSGKMKRRVSSELTPRQQEAYTLVHVGGKTPQQAAIEMRCTAQNVYKLLGQAEAKVKAKQARSIDHGKAQKIPTDKRGQPLI